MQKNNTSYEYSIVSLLFTISFADVLSSLSRKLFPCLFVSNLHKYAMLCVCINERAFLVKLNGNMCNYVKAAFHFIFVHFYRSGNFNFIRWKREKILYSLFLWLFCRKALQHILSLQRFSRPYIAKVACQKKIHIVDISAKPIRNLSNQ